MSGKSERAIPGTAPNGSGYHGGAVSSAASPRGRSKAASLPVTPRVRRLDPARDLRELVLFMRLPVFALAPGRTEDFHVVGQRNGAPMRISVSATSASGGHATVADAEALIPLVAELMALKNEGQPLPHSLALRPCDALHALGRPRGGRQINLLAAGFVRLMVITISITDADGTRTFSPIEHFERPPAGQSGPWQLTLATDLVAEVEAGRVLKVDHAALRLTGLARRLYSVVRVHTGHGDGVWRVDLGVLVRLCAWQGTWRKFCRRIADLATAQALPGFILTVADQDGRPVLTVARDVSSRLAAHADAPTANPSDGGDFNHPDYCYSDAPVSSAPAAALPEILFDFDDEPAPAAALPEILFDFDDEPAPAAAMPEISFVFDDFDDETAGPCI